MRTFEKRYLNALYLIYRWVAQLFDPIRLVKAPLGFIRFFRDWFRYSRMDGAEEIKLMNTNPIVHEATPFQSVLTHYFYQDIWAFKKILESSPKLHVDVGSRIELVTNLSVITKVEYVDIRPLNIDLDNFKSVTGDILQMPYERDSLESLSCLHVAEHIGLGRYGDALNPDGTRRAARELARVLAIGGNLFFSIPVGRPRLCFNSHRIHSPLEIIEMFPQLRLLEFSGVDDLGKFRPRISPADLATQSYACGFYSFIKDSPTRSQ